MKFTTLSALLCLVTSTVQGQDYNHPGDFDMQEQNRGLESFGDATRELYKEDRDGPSSPSSDEGCPAISPVNPKSFKLNNKSERHYLVGMKATPLSDVPPILANKTSGGWLNGLGGSPFNFIPNVGYSDMERFFKDDDDIDRTFWVLSAGGYGFSFNSQDYGLHFQVLKIEVPFTFRAGGYNFPERLYSPTITVQTVMLSDPEGYIEWENGADIEVAYRIPDLSWIQFKKDRVLTGRDFQPLGMAIIDENDKCSIISEGWNPSIFGLDPVIGTVTSPFIRVPEITFYNGTWKFTDKYDDAPAFLSTASDKVHCSDNDLWGLDGCGISDPDDVEDTDDGRYRKVDPGTGFSGLTWLKSGYVVGFLQFTVELYEYERHEYDEHDEHNKRSRRRLGGGGTGDDEPGARIYLIDPGDCTADCEPIFKFFIGFYPFEFNGNRIGDTSVLRDDDRKVLVIEQRAFPQGKEWPPKKNPASKLCIVDITSRDPIKWVLTKKKCLINFYAIQDPFGIGPSNESTYAFSFFNADALWVYDDYCFLVGTANDFPFTNDFNDSPAQNPFFAQFQFPNFMIVCFLEPVLDRGYPHF